MGAKIEDNLSRSVTHVLPMNWGALKQFGCDSLANFKGSILLYQWLEDSLKAGEVVPEDGYIVEEDAAAGKKTLLDHRLDFLHNQINRTWEQIVHNSNNATSSSPEASGDSFVDTQDTAKGDAINEGSTSSKEHNEISHSIMEIVTTGKLSKLEHFEQDEKARTLSLCLEKSGNFAR